MKKVICYVIAVLVLAFSSCDDFFSTSLWPSTLKYDAANINVNAENVDQWLDSARGNPELTAALLDKITRDLESGKYSGAEKAKLIEAGIKLAVQSSGLGTSIISNASNVLGNLDNVDEDTLLDLLDGIQSDFSRHGGPTAAANLSTIAATGISGNPPQFEPAYKSTAKPGDVAEAIFVLALGELGPTANIEDWSNPDVLGLDISEDGHITVIDPNPSPGKLALAAYLNLINDGGPSFNDNPLTSVIKDTFSFIAPTD
jgi:hypothetical protein